MTANLALVLTSSVLVAAGVYLLLERSLTRVLIGIILISNGVNIAFLVAGGRVGGAPIVGVTEPARMSDSLPQAMVLTAIVITLGITAFLLAEIKACASTEATCTTSAAAPANNCP